MGMAEKTNVVYVRLPDALKEKLRRLAEAQGLGDAPYIRALIEAQPEPRQPEKEDDMEQITVETGEDYNITEAFTGRWLVEPDRKDSRTGEEGWDAGAYWGVAHTKRGNIAIYSAHCNEGFAGKLEVYKTLDDAGNDVPEDILAMAASAMGEKRVIWRDI